MAPNSSEICADRIFARKTLASNVGLKNITLKFFPPNTTALSQPCDQGIIQNLKVHYRKDLLRKRILAFDNRVEFVINLFDALNILQERPRVSENEAYKAMQIVQDYVQSNSANPAILKYSDELDDFISRECMKKKTEQDQ
ncbi:DDE superfamily endonuclease domain-containing protein [Ditylenchus destructor]|uniref:DDE superfamily endonuclease domain-containing protein n=1 Tax=Ditylenchus destructor TaxID=166010 RepID=A0AAD4NDK3_9BILA|nr:DDE superfamily endonuclease domain-containing protein [Ditylenchus destructor]